jgi:rRNA maturation RNase YbeY
LSIKIYYDETDFRVLGWRRALKTIEKVIRNENKVSGDLNFIVTNDEKLRKLNVKFLRHDYNTDVITFNYNEGNEINGEVYISLDTVKENAKEYKTKLKEEILRVLFHGVLHLVGYDDKTGHDRKKMREMEDYWLKRMDE